MARVRLGFALQREAAKRGLDGVTAFLALVEAFFFYPHGTFSLQNALGTRVP